MRMPRARINVRSVMIVVAVVAISLAIGMETGRWNRFRAVYQHTAYRHDIDEYWERERSKSHHLKIAKDAGCAWLRRSRRMGDCCKACGDPQKTSPDGEDYASRRAGLAERNIRAAARRRAKGRARCNIRRLSRGLGSCASTGAPVSRPWAAIEPDPPPPPGPAGILALLI